MRSGIPQVQQRFVGRKEKALVLIIEPEGGRMAIEEEEEEQECVGNDFHGGREGDNTIDLIDQDENYEGGSQPHLTNVHLTSLELNIKDLNCKRNVMTPRTFFSDDVVVKKADPSFGSTNGNLLSKEGKIECCTLYCDGVFICCWQK